MNERILVVDDNRDTADSLAKLINSFGYKALAAYDGRRAIEQAREFLPDMALIEAHFDAHSEPIDAGEPSPRLVCRDPDDQKFIDLALARNARWLISRDKALLALAKRAKPRGLLIQKPEFWTPE